LCTEHQRADAQGFAVHLKSRGTGMQIARVEGDVLATSTFVSSYLTDCSRLLNID
jgi:hypothetical protein